MANTKSYQTFEIDPYAAATILTLNSILTITDISVISNVQKENGKRDITIVISETPGAKTNKLVIHPITMDFPVAVQTDITLKDNVTFQGGAIVPCVVLGEKTIVVFLAAVVETGTADLKYSTEKLTIVPGTASTGSAVTTTIVIVHNETIVNTAFATQADTDQNGKVDATLLLVTLA